MLDVLPRPALRGERVGVRGSFRTFGLADSPPHPALCADLSPQAGRGEEGSLIHISNRHFANSFSPNLISCAVSAFSPALREADAMAAAACG